MRIAVTGGSGFIGAHVVDRLLDAGHDVRSMDVLAGPAIPRADLRTVDVCDLAGLTEALRGCDAVFHLAGMSNVDLAFADPVRTVRLNVDGTANVCEAARRVGVGRVVLASTVWVYGAVADPADPAVDDPPTGCHRDRRDRTDHARRRGSRLHLDEDRGRAAAAQLPADLRPAVHDPAVRRPLRPGHADELALARFVHRAAPARR